MNENEIGSLILYQMNRKTRENWSSKREQRAIRLFEYIEKCENLEKERKRRMLLEHVTAQRKKLADKSIQLVNSKREEYELIEETRKKRNKEVPLINDRNATSFSHYLNWDQLNFLNQK
jgi:hypothetical protein